jgi:glucose-6-phosphate dehydrogenase assembly protein OpcA
MPQSTSDAFLSGQGIPVDLGRVEDELTRLWGPAAERAGGPELEHPNVTRVALANLVVEAGVDCPECLEATLDTVVARYPCRSIVLSRTRDSARTVTAEVAALCHLASPGMPQVCSERIVLRAGPGAVDLLPGAVRPLLEADLPFVLWWTEDPTGTEALFRDLAGECSRLILDLPDPSATAKELRLGLDPDINPYLRDTAWFGLTRWRELVAQFFDGPDRGEILDSLHHVEVEAEAPGPNVPRIAAWLVAWLAGQLGWTHVGNPQHTPGRVEAHFQGREGLITIVITSTENPASDLARVLAVSLVSRDLTGEHNHRLRRVDPSSPQVRVDVTSPTACAMPRVVLSPDLAAADRVTAALESARHDPPFVRALPHMLWLLDHEKPLYD